MPDVDRHQPLPGITALPGYLLGKVGRRVRIGLGLVVLVAVVLTVVVLAPTIRHDKREQAAADRRAEARAVVRERRRLRADQRAHHAVTVGRAGAVRDLEAGVTRDARARVRRGVLPPPPVQRTVCSPTKLDAPGRAALRAGGRLFYCEAMTSATASFEFVAVADYRRHRLTWCKINGAATGGPEPLATVPLPRECVGLVR